MYRGRGGQGVEEVEEGRGAEENGFCRSSCDLALPLQDYSGPSRQLPLQLALPLLVVASALPAAAYSQSQPQPLVVLAQCQPQPAAVSEQQLAASAVSAVLVPAGVPPAPDLAPGWPEQVRDDTHAHTNCCGEKGKAQAQRREALTRPTVHRSVR